MQNEEHFLVVIKFQIVVSCTYEEGKPALMQVLNTSTIYDVQQAFI